MSDNKSVQRRIEVVRRLTSGLQDYSAWLIEVNDPSGPEYFQFVADNDWTPDYDEALHFGRKIDAERVIEYYGWTRAKPVEHMWPAPRPSHEAGGK